MTKCDFCVYSDPQEGCYWTLRMARIPYCEEAIDKMTAALKKAGKKADKERES